MEAGQEPAELDGRVGEPEEIGDAIATPASEGLRWMTAQRIEVSGGALL